MKFTNIIKNAINTKVQNIEKADKLFLDFDKYLCQPVELSLKIQKKEQTVTNKKGKKITKTSYDPIFKAVKTKQDENGVSIERDNVDIINFEDNFDEQQGLISLLKSLKEKGQKIKVMICITAYNEGADQLDITMRGIKKNLRQFEIAGVSPSEIAVVVIFDGIDKMNNNQKDKQENILKMFEILDLKFQINENKTMQHQFDEYSQAKLDANLNVEEFFENNSKNELKILKFDARRNKVYQSIKKEYMKNHNLESIDIHTEEKLQKEALRQIKKNGMKYIQERHHTAWVYQARLLVQDEKTELVKGAHKEEQDVSESSSDSESEESNYKKTRKIRQQKRKYEQMLKEQNNIDTEQKFTEDILDDLKESYLNVFFCTKFRNAQKLNSHMWFFKGFCEFLDPKYTILVDTGLEPSDQALYKFFQTMERDNDIGGVCGFMSLRNERIVNDQGERLDNLDNGSLDFISRFLHTFFDIQKAQIFEYDIAHIVDKAFESLTGFIHVLPGAFSGYRYSALKGILFEYLKTELDPSKTHDTLQEANMFLAEDRILCLDLYCHEGKKYTLKYVPNAECNVDPVKNLPVMMAQRRRWNNGSWYALNYVLAQYRKKVSRSTHNAWDILKLIFAMYYALLNKMVTFFQIALYFTVLIMIYGTAFDGMTIPQPDQFFDGRFVYSNMSLVNLMIFIYLMIVGGMIYFSLMFKSNSKQAFGLWYTFSTIFGIYMIISFVFMADSIIQAVFFPNSQDQETTLFSRDELQLFKYMIYITILGYCLPILLDGVYRRDVRKALRFAYSLLSFTFYSPTYIHMFGIYSFCNVDDLSWGTKGSAEVAGEAQMQLQYDEKDFRKKYANLSEDQIQTQIKAHKAVAQKILENQQKKQEIIKQSFSREKFLFIFKWLTLNIVLAAILSYFVQAQEYKKVILLGIGYFGSGIIVIRCVGSVLYYVKLFTTDYVCCCFSGNKKRVRKNRSNRVQLESKLREIAKKIYNDKNSNNSFINKEIQQLESNQKYVNSKLSRLLKQLPKGEQKRKLTDIIQSKRRGSVMSNGDQVTIDLNNSRNQQRSNTYFQAPNNNNNTNILSQTNNNTNILSQTNILSNNNLNTQSKDNLIVNSQNGKSDIIDNNVLQPQQQYQQQQQINQSEVGEEDQSTAANLNNYKTKLSLKPSINVIQAPK